MPHSFLSARRALALAIRHTLPACHKLPESTTCCMATQGCYNAPARQGVIVCSGPEMPLNLGPNTKGSGIFIASFQGKRMMTQTRPNQATPVADTAATRATPEFNSSVVPLTLLAQTGVSLLLGLIFWFVFGKTTALSVLMGGATAVIPNAFLAARMLRPGGSAESMMRMAWVGEIGKLLITGLMFGAIFALVRPVSPVAVIGGYIAAQLVILGALYVDGRAGYKTSNTSE